MVTGVLLPLKVYVTTVGPPDEPTVEFLPQPARPANRTKQNENRRMDEDTKTPLSIKNFKVSVTVTTQQNLNMEQSS